jgi:hypothetical protein
MKILLIAITAILSFTAPSWAVHCTYVQVQEEDGNFYTCQVCYDRNGNVMSTTC